MTGRELHRMWVLAGLCSDADYRWETLSEAMRERWNALAAGLHLKLARP